jgi:hypothetical protein
MPLASRIGARAAAAVTNHIKRNGPPEIMYHFGREPAPYDKALTNANERHYGTPYGIPHKTFSEQFIDESEKKTTDPIDLFITGKGISDSMEKSKYNDERRELFANQTPARPYIRNPVFYTPIKPGNPYNDPTGKNIPQPTFSSPVGPSSKLSSPPPPNSLSLSVQGTSKPITASPSFMRDLAPTSHKTNPGDIVKALEFEGEEEVDNPNKYKTPKSSPFKGPTVPNKNRNPDVKNSSPTRPPFRI